MYEPPIKLIMQDIQHKIIEQQTDDVYRAVVSMGIEVDKDELIKALNYDRGQYDKGLLDGLYRGGNKPADESAATWWSDVAALEDRKLFVHNLGALLRQTREQIVSAELDDNEIVTVTFECGATKKINVNMDSYLVIIRDVSKYVE